MKIQFLFLSLILTACATSSNPEGGYRKLSSLEESCKGLMEKEIGAATNWSGCTLETFAQNGKRKSKKKIKSFGIQLHQGFDANEGGVNYNMYYFCLPGAHCTTINVEQAPGYEATCTTDSVGVKTRHGATIGLGFFEDKFAFDYLEPQADLFLRLECKPAKKTSGRSEATPVQPAVSFMTSNRNFCLGKPVRRFGRIPLPWCFEKVDGQLFCDATEAAIMKTYEKECSGKDQI